MAINLIKGQRIDLKKLTGAALNDFCVGVNWGGIETKGGFLGLSKTVQDVDLDLSAALLDTQGALCDHIYSPLYKAEGLAQFGLPPGKLTAASGALRHTGDDRSGDSGGDDGLDNEIITVNLSKVPANVGQIIFFLNNCGGEADQGIAPAQYNLGLCYAHGTGVAQDDEEAVKWYRKAADQGLADAQHNLGNCYENGTGVAQDEEEAVKWYRKEADQRG